MRLVSEHVVDGVQGPGATRVYPTLSGIDLTDHHRFSAGQPFVDFARMRAEAPVMWHPAPHGAAGFWAVTRYKDVMAVNADPATYSSERGGILITLAPPGRRHDQLFSASMNAMINLDGPHHRQLRKQHMPFFTATYMRELRLRVASEVTRRLDAMAASGRADFVSSFAAHLPVFTLCEMLGVPGPDRGKFIRWIHFLELANQIGAERAATPLDQMSPETLAFIEVFNDTMAEMFEYGRGMLASRRVHPQNDLMSAIAMAQVDGQMLSDEYLDGSWLLIVFAGNDTTRNSLSGAMRLFTENPVQRAKLIANEALLPNAVHEITRLISPVIYMRRTATEDTSIAGQAIREGEKVVIYYGAANRDDSVFENPDSFDITRKNAEKNIAFGYGPHICIGRLAAQLQLEESYRQIFCRFPDMTWTGGIDIAPNNFVHAIRRLDVEFTPERKAA